MLSTTQKILITPSVKTTTTELYIGENLLQDNLIVDLCLQSQGCIVIIVDSALKELYGYPLATALNAIVLTIPNGELAKNKDTIEYLENELFSMGCAKDTLLIAIGGGVTTDLVGFLASTYLRGVPVIFIPTTLLAMVDASIGGKTAINTCYGKNLIGSFYLPKAIIADLNTLKTLPQKQLLNGLAEILKIGLVFDNSIWQLAVTDLYNRELIVKAIQGKISIVEQDPTEKGLRRILNFGHTIGHALEKVSNYTLSHGEAVAIGSLTEAYLSMQLLYLSEKDFEAIQIAYSSFSLKLPKEYSREALFKALLYDKKKIMGKQRFVLIDRIGHALPFEGNYCKEISLEKLQTSLTWMEKIYG